MYEGWIGVVSQRLGAPVNTNGDEVRFNCWRPDCGASPDTKHHLYLNPRKGKYFCQRCQRGGTLESLARALEISPPEDNLLSWDQAIRNYLWGESIEEEDQPSISWPQEYSPISPGFAAYTYLLERGVSNKKIEEYEIGFGVGSLKNRIIFPDVDERGRLVYWVARKYGKLDGNKRAPKYTNADAPRKFQVYNLGRIRQKGWNRRLVICEGPISALVAGLDAVATYGKYVTKEQVAKLVACQAEEYVVALDGDAILQSTSLATRLYRKGLNVKFVRFSHDEDPASVGVREMRRRICQAFPWDGISSLKVMV